MPSTKGKPINGKGDDDLLNGTSLGENINGKGGNDLIYANDGNDTVTGGSGNDQMDGGNGIDTAVVSGHLSDYSFSWVPNTIPGTTPTEALQIVGPDGTDLLINFEFITIGRVTYDLATLAPNHAPTGIPDTATGTTVDENVAAGVQVADLNATDVDVGDTVSYYFKDGGGNPVQTDGNFNIDATTGVVTTARPFDFETDGSSLNFTAFAGDGRGGEDSGIYTIPIGNVTPEPQVVDFQDLWFYSGSQNPIPVGYAGFNWSASNAPSYAGPPSDVVVYAGNIGGFNITPDNSIAFNAFGAIHVEISRIGGNFDLKSLDLINYFYGANQVLVTAYDGGVQEQQTSLDLTSATSLTTFTLNWSDIDTITIDVTGAPGSGYWGMDNLTITT